MLARTLSFTRTAAALGYVQSNVSAQVRALENELGTRLFDRLGRRVTLTDAGRTLLGYADRIADLLEEARDVAAGGDEVAGTLTVSAPESLCTYRLPAVLRELRARHPRLRVVFRPCPVADLRRRVGDGDLDAAFLLDELAPSATLRSLPLAREPIRLTAAPDHPLARCRRVAPTDLTGEHLLLTERGCAYRARFERQLSTSGAHPASVLEFASIEAIKQCAMLDMGIAVLPEMTLANELAQGRLVALPWADDDFTSLMQVAYHKEKASARAVRALLAVSADVLGAHAPDVAHDTDAG